MTVRRRILMVTRNFPPLVGGMERLNQHLFGELTEEFSVALCGPHGCRDHLPAPAAAVATFPAQPIPLFIARSLIATLILARRYRPELIIAGSGVTAPAAGLAARLLRIPILVYLHGLDLVAENGLYQTIFVPLIRRCSGFLVNSRATAALAVARGIAVERIHILHPGTDLPEPHRNTTDFQTRIGAAHRPILLSVGRLTARKGLVEFVRHSLPPLIADCPDLLLVIIGAAADQALDSRHRGVLEALTGEIAAHGLERHVLLLGRVDDATVSQAYQSSRALVFPVLDLPGDIEGFGMVAVEAAAHGLPTVAFAVGGVTDAIAEGQSGYLIAAGDYGAMNAAILTQLRHSKISADSCQRFAERFDWRCFGEQLRTICRQYLPQGRAHS